MMTYYLLRGGMAAGRVVPLPLLYGLAGVAARVAYLLPTRARAAVRANIAHVMGRPPESRAVRRAAAQAFHCQALNYVDLMRLDRVTPAELGATLVHGDLRPLTDCVAHGKGAIIVSAHLGNMDYVVQWLGLHGYRVHTVMERLQPERLFDLVRRQREGSGLRIYPLEPASATGGARGAAGARSASASGPVAPRVPEAHVAGRGGPMGALTAALRSGGVVALLADRDISGSGETVQFFGAPARLAVGPALLGLRTGAPLVAAFGRRLRDDRLYVSVRPPVTLVRTRDLRADLRRGMQVVADLLQDGIAQAPEQWIVFEPVWKDGAA